MKNYIAPVVDLLYVSNEDVLTISNDNALGDIFFENKTNNSSSTWS